MKDKKENKEGKIKQEKLEEIEYKTSRVSFLSNYLIGALAIIFFILVLTTFDLNFSILPKSGKELFDTLVILGIAAIAAGLIEQPEWVRFMRTYFVTRDEVVEVEGILSKRKIILPYQSISEITVKRNLLGRILNYGDVYIGAFRAGSDINMKGIKNAHKVHEIIQNRINLLRKGQLEFWEKSGEKKDIAD
jgi:membrane protein YdbS with pleckstrin-like domain